ncbi:family 20 glycosylhydrolase [candidate division KSB1 bacterium]|nr:family 20 glycosylhydrolase [candidate division KSB1 bacterium]
MIKAVKLFLLSIIFLSTYSASAKADFFESFKIIPSPQRIEFFKGDSLKFNELTGIYLENIDQRPVMGSILSGLPQTEQAQRQHILILQRTEQNVPESSEGYILQIRDSNITISARSEAGLFYGCQTLEQLLEDARDQHIAIPACKIIDYPVMNYRAIHIDVKHHLDRMRYYYDIVDRAARYKINAIIFEFEDKLGYRRRPLIAAPHGISIEEMAALTRYARERRIEISPLVQGLGHATFILKHGKYRHLRDNPTSPWTFCPMNEETYELQFDLYRDAIEATPGSRFLHIGGDEVELGHSSLSREFLKTHDEADLYLHWLKTITDFVKRQGRTPILWDDMPFKFAGLWQSVEHGRDETEEEAATVWNNNLSTLNQMVQRFPQDAIFVRWHYGTAHTARYPGMLRVLDWYRSMGLQAWIATAAQTSNELFPHKDHAIATKKFIDVATEYGIPGNICTAWDDASPHFETYWFGFIAAAEYSWQPDGRTLPEFEDAYQQREFGPFAENVLRVYKNMCDAAKFWSRAFYKSSFRRKNQNVLYHDFSTPTALSFEQYKQRFIDVPDLSQPGSWKQSYHDRLEGAREILKKCRQNHEWIRHLKNKSIRNRYHWQICDAINDFSATPAQLLLALQKMDTANTEQRKAGVQPVMNAFEQFDAAWENLKMIFGKTRFLTYPQNYVQDRYSHFASQAEDISFMIQTEKLFHPLVREWLRENGYLSGDF